MNDCHKTLLCLKHGVSVIRLDQPSLWDAKFNHWQDVLKAMILFAYFRSVGGKPCVITSRSNVKDLSYSPYHKLLKGNMNTMNTDYEIFEMYHSDDSRNSIICFNCRTEQQYLVTHMPLTIDLSRIPDENITLSLIAGKNKQSSDSRIIPVVQGQVQVPETVQLSVPSRKTSSKVPTVGVKKVQSNKIENYYHSAASSSNAFMLLATNEQRLDKTVPTLPPIIKNSLVQTPPITKNSLVQTPPITKNSSVKKVIKPVQLNGMKDYFPKI